MGMSRALLVSLPIVCAVYGSLAAQTFPSKPVTVVIPFPAGGPTDVIARMLGDQMRAALGQPIVFENVGGAGGNLGTGRVARAMGDGHTLQDYCPRCKRILRGLAYASGPREEEKVFVGSRGVE